MSNVRYPWRYAGFLMGYYASNALYQGYVTLNLRAAGLSTQLIGLTMSALPLFAIAAQFIWGGIADRAGSRTRVLRAAILIAGACMLAMGLARGGAFAIIALFLFGACYPTIQPMGDSILLEALGEQPFGPLRMSACVAFAVCSLGFGYVLEGHAMWFGYMMSALLMGVAGLSLMLPDLPGHQRSSARVKLREVFAVPGMKRLIGLFMALQVTVGYYFAFYPLYFTGLTGGSEWLLGVSYFVATLSELPFLKMGDRLFDRVGAGRLMRWSAGVLGVRWALLALVPDVRWVIASQVLHGGGFIVFTFAMAKYVAYSVPEALRARGQTLLAVAGFGAARIVGNLLGTWVSGAYGWTAGFLSTAAICALLFTLPPVREADVGSDQM